MTAKRGSPYPAMALTSQAAPPPPPAKRMGAGAKILVLLIVIGIVLVGLWYFGIFTPTVKVTAANWTIEYPGGTVFKWFGDSPSSSCATCPTTTLAGASFTLTFTVEANGLFGNHEVDNVTIAAPFTFESILPALPYTVNAGQSRSFNVSIKAPTTGGDYILSGTIETS